MSRSFPAFSVRLPPELAAKVRAKAKAEKRSLTSQIEYDLEKIYGK